MARDRRSTGRQQVARDGAEPNPGAAESAPAPATPSAPLPHAMVYCNPAEGLLEVLEPQTPQGALDPD